MTNPICFKCRYFKQYHPLTFYTPGECKWEPKEAVPEWLGSWLGVGDRYYGPQRDVSTKALVRTECPAFEQVSDAE